MDTLKIAIDVENGTISVYNNGRGIPIEIHSKEKIFIPELIFGHLLSSSNYDDDEKKLTGGRNGYGAKLANIYSTEFTIDTADKNSSQNFKQYIEMYLNSAAETAAENSGGAAQAKQTIIYERISDRWEVGFAVSDGTFQHVSFANSISTIKGGSHVNYIADQIAKHLNTAITKKNKAAAIKLPKIKEHMWIFVNALIENPTFDSQTKETMTLLSSKFGSKPTLTEEFMKKGEAYLLPDGTRLLTCP